MGIDDFPDETADQPAILHGSCVAVAGRGVLIVGKSGAGKSALALRLMALGAQLVGDDRIAVSADGDQVIADSVDPIRGLIEARGLGLLRAHASGPVPIDWVIDLDRPAPQRLPEPASVRLLGLNVPLLRAAGTPNLPAALVQLMKMGRVDSQWPN